MKEYRFNAAEKFCVVEDYWKNFQCHIINVYYSTLFEKEHDAGKLRHEFIDAVAKIIATDILGKMPLEEIINILKKQTQQAKALPDQKS